jgi:menaquinol-cytochrome c reductase cytochrome b/c subunit
MARDDTPLDQEVFDRVMKEQVDAGTDKRVAEGRARSAAVRAYKAAHPEEEAAPAAAPTGGNGEAPAQAAPAAAAPAQAAPAGAMVAAGPVSAPTRAAPLPTGNIPEPKKGAPEKHRLLALVPPEGIQRVEREQGDRVNVWPHLLIEEFVAMFVLSVGLVVFSTFLNAPLRELANANLTPNPSKAPWYFLGLQELLRYFHPMVAGILIPGVAIAFLIVLPYVDRNPSTKPGDRKLAIVLFTMFMMLWAVLTIIGAFFRGPGQNFVWPWTQGIFFDL